MSFLTVMAQEILVLQEHVGQTFTLDIDLSNEARGGNDVDGTWGSYTIQEERMTSS